MTAVKLFQSAGLAKSGSDAKRLIESGGAYINEKRVESFEYIISEKDFENKELTLRAGKKRYHKVKLK